MKYANFLVLITEHQSIFHPASKKLKVSIGRLKEILFFFSSVVYILILTRIQYDIGRYEISKLSVQYKISYTSFSLDGDQLIMYDLECGLVQVR